VQHLRRGRTHARPQPSTQHDDGKLRSHDLHTGARSMTGHRDSS
jgi:hypothetical protein